MATRIYWESKFLQHEGDLRVIRGPVIYWTPETGNVERDGLLVQELVANENDDGFEVTGSHWKTVCPLCDAVAVYGLGATLPRPIADLAKKLQAIGDNGLIPSQAMYDTLISECSSKQRALTTVCGPLLSGNYVSH